MFTETNLLLHFSSHSFLIRRVACSYHSEIQLYILSLLIIIEENAHYIHRARHTADRLASIESSYYSLILVGTFDHRYYDVFFSVSIFCCYYLYAIVHCTWISSTTGFNVLWIGSKSREKHKINTQKLEHFIISNGDGPTVSSYHSFWIFLFFV